MTEVRSTFGEKWRGILATVLLVLSCLLQVHGSRFACAQDEIEKSFRKIYVPANDPKGWPSGEWQPISIRRFQQLEAGESLELTENRDTRIRKAIYTAEFREGALRNGVLQLELTGQEHPEGWIRLGEPNIQLQSLSWETSSDHWGKKRDGEFLVYADGSSRQLSGNWGASGVAMGEVTEFDLKLFDCLQSVLQIRVPVDMRVMPRDQDSVAVYATEPRDGMRQWTLIGLEKSAIEFAVGPENRVSDRPLVVKRTIHLMNVSLSGTRLTSDFQIGGDPGWERECLLQFPRNFLLDSARLDKQDVLSRLSKISEGDDNSPVYRLQLSPETAKTRMTLRIRGILDQNNDRSVKTEFPRLLDAKSVEGEINLTVDPSLQVRSLSTSDLLQTEAQFQDSGRDLWSFQLLGDAPGVQLTTALPDPKLEIDQLVHGHPTGDNLVVVHDMLCTATEPGLLQTEFQVANGFQINNVEAWSLDGNAPELDWTSRRQQGANWLKVDFGQSLDPARPVLLRVNTLARRAANRQQTFTWPVLFSSSGRLESLAIAENEFAIQKTIPESASVDEAGVQESLVTIKKLTGDLPFSAWSDSKRILDVSTANRILMEQANRDDFSDFAVGEEEENQQIARFRTSLVNRNGRATLRYLIHLPANILRQQDAFSWMMNEAHRELDWKPLFEMADQPGESDVPSGDDIVDLFVRRSDADTPAWTVRWSRGAIRGPLEIVAYQSFSLDASGSYEPSLPVPLNDIEVSGAITNEAEGQYELLVDERPLQDQSLQYQLPSKTSLPSLRIKAVESMEPSGTDGTESEAAGARKSARLLCYRSSRESERVACELILDVSPADLASDGPEIRFSNPVIVEAIQLNDTSFAIDEEREHLTIPEFDEPLDRIRIRYSSDSSRAVPVPESALVPETMKVFLCQHENMPPPGNSESRFWKQVSSESLSGDTGWLNERIARSLEGGHHQLWEGRWIRGASTLLNIGIPQEGESPTFAALLFVLTFVGLFTLYSLTWISRRILLTMALLLTLFLAVMHHSHRPDFLSPVVAAVVLVSQLAPILQNSLLRLVLKKRKKGEPRENVLKYLLPWQQVTVWLLAVLLLSQARAQETSSSNGKEANPTQRDVLIPVASSKLTSEFEGLSANEFPTVVYVRQELLESSRTEKRGQEESEEYLFRSAEYELITDSSDNYSLRCQYEVIERHSPPLQRIVLPITEISGISALQARVNGQVVNMTPLPENQGLEIPLTPASLTSSSLSVDSPQNLPTSPFGEQSSPFRRYRIEVQVVPEQERTADGLRLTMRVPKSPRTAINVPDRLADQCRIAGASRQLRDEAPEGESLRIWHGPTAEKLELLLTETGRRDSVVSDRGLVINNSAMLVEAMPQYLDMTWQLAFDSREEQPSEFEIDFPPDYDIEDVVGAELLHFQDSPIQQQWKRGRFRLSSEASANPQVLLRCRTLTSPLDQTKLFQVPNVVGVPLPGNRQLAFQTRVPGYRIQCDAESGTISRLTRESFQKQWQDPDSVLDSVQCFRMNRPQSLRVRLELLEENLTIQANHTVQLEKKGFLLRSTFNGWPSGPPLWRLKIDKESRWDVESATLEMAGQPIALRKVSRDRNVEYLLEQPVSEPFQLRVTWRMPRNLKKSRYEIIPPYIGMATSTEETVRLINEFSEYQWVLSEQRSGIEEPPEAAPIRRSWKAERNSADVAPLSLIRRKMPPTKASEEPLPGEEVERPENIATAPDDRKTDHSRETNRKMEPKAIVDHTLFQETNGWFGETLIVWPSPDESDAVGIQETIHWDQPIEILGLSESGNLEIDRATENVNIRRSATEAASPDFLLLQWHVSGDSHGMPRSEIPLPYLESVASTQWRVVNRTEASRSTEGRSVSWVPYWNLLAELGRQAEEPEKEEATSSESEFSNIFSDSESEPESPWLSHWRDSESEVPDGETALRFLRGRSRLREASWVMQTSDVYEGVVSHDRVSYSKRSVSVISAELMTQWLLGMLTFLWGVGLLCSHRTSHLLFRRRHLLLLSVVVAGLVLFLPTWS